MMSIFTRKTAALAAAVCALHIANGFAQVQVVDSNNRLINNAARPATSLPASSSDVNAEMFHQMQVLQQEVSQLRGQVEELTYELKRLKQQRLDDYVDFDRRLSAMRGQAGGTGFSPEEQQVNSPTSATQPQSAGAPGSDSEAEELQSYRTAIDLVLRQKDYARAITAFQQHLAQFPRGRYAANCQYWLGEIYLLENNLEQAREWFSRLLAENANHAKAPDATYKLGTVYDKLGDKARARQLLLKVAGGDTNAARLASAYLADMGN